MDNRIFEKFRDLILTESGISLSEEKRLLLANRLRKRLRQLGLQNENEYLAIVLGDESKQELGELIDAISTNHTFFFREKSHFDFLTAELQGWSASNKKLVKGWCAGCSTGEEPLSISILANENYVATNRAFKLLATDISPSVLSVASEGVYEIRHLQNVPHQYRSKYFSKVNPDLCKANDSLSSLILFKLLNLSLFPYPLQGGFDFIFCRNVMIYFEDDLRARLIGEMTRLLRPGGYLFIGHSETVPRGRFPLKMVKSAVYQKTEDR
jgi:chemotaxis protein methyltransferase CheR